MITLLCVVVVCAVVAFVAHLGYSAVQDVAVGQELERAAHRRQIDALLARDPVVAASLAVGTPRPFASPPRESRQYVTDDSGMDGFYVSGPGSPDLSALPNPWDTVLGSADDFDDTDSED